MLKNFYLKTIILQIISTVYNITKKELISCSRNSFLFLWSSYESMKRRRMVFKDTHAFITYSNFLFLWIILFRKVWIRDCLEITCYFIGTVFIIYSFMRFHFFRSLLMFLYGLKASLIKIKLAIRTPVNELKMVKNPTVKVIK